MTPISRLSTFAALRHRNYRLFWTGMVVSLVGMWVQSTATSFLVWELTRSAFATSLNTLFFSLPSTVLALVGGVVADRVDRRRLLLVTQAVFMLSSAVLTVLTFRDLIQVWHIYVLTMLNGTIMAFDAPARQSLVPSLVDRVDLTNAIALNSTAFNASRVIGPPIGASSMPPSDRRGVLRSTRSAIPRFSRRSMSSALPPPLFAAPPILGATCGTASVMPAATP